jgi:hypothetical protein
MRHPGAEPESQGSADFALFEVCGFSSASRKKAAEFLEAKLCLPACTNRNTSVVQKFFVRVDVTEQFPFLVTKLSPYYDRW